MKLSFWPHGHRPSAGELLVAIGKLAVFGGIVGASGCLIATATGVNLALFPAVSDTRDLAISTLCGMVFAVSFYLCCGLPWVYLGPMMVRFPPNFKKPITALVGAVGSSLGLTISLFGISRFPGIHNVWNGHMGQTLLGEAVFGAVLALIIGAIRRLQFEVTQMVAKLHDQEMRESQLAEGAAKAQAAALQSQINPHFFFNTLNTLSALIAVENVEAQELVGRLADMFRYTLACSRAESVTLEQELAFTENYLRLEQARFRDRLRVTLPHGDFSDITIPGLSLQPLVENAIKYGVAKRVDGGTVEVAVRRSATGCAVDVFSPSRERPFFRTGHALENVRDRLKLFAGEKASVDIAQETLDRVRVSLVLPA